MPDTSDERAWVVTERDLVRRLVAPRGARPAKVPEDDSEDGGAPRIAGETSDAELVEVEWTEFFERLESREQGVEVAYDRDRSTWSFSVVPADGGESVPAAVRYARARTERRETSTKHHERATDDANQDNHRDEEPFVN